MSCGFSDGSVSIPVLADLSEYVVCKVQSGFGGMDEGGIHFKALKASISVFCADRNRKPVEGAEKGGDMREFRLVLALTVYLF